ncbi:MAG: 50S ribosomal protein L11 methyltransferase [Gammaproteobacteria bacterium]|jgi:protein arginine N-methyltransferase 1|nr:50S ribosomal protein L11 methyltransferase [Gammaproteobacteria bacterium]
MLIEFHRSMLADGVRNAALHAALQRVIVPGVTTVADIGTGTGLLAFMASRLGARTVHCYEHGDVIGLARRLARRNRIRNLVFYPEHSTAILDPEPVDVVVSETLGNFAYEEGIVETLADARRFLKPGGTLIPRSIEQRVAPVTSPRFQAELSAWDGVGFGLDFGPAKRMSLNNLYVRTIEPGDLLGGPDAAATWDRVTLGRRAARRRAGEVGWTLDAPATIQGFALWWRCELVPGIALATGPSDPRTHWEQIYLPTLEPVAAAPGDRVALRIVSDGTEEGVNVSWRIRHRPAGSPRAATQALDMRRGFLG